MHSVWNFEAHTLILYRPVHIWKVHPRLGLDATHVGASRDRLILSLTFPVEKVWKFSTPNHLSNAATRKVSCNLYHHHHHHHHQAKHTWWHWVSRARFCQRAAHMRRFSPLIKHHHANSDIIIVIFIVFVDDFCRIFSFTCLEYEELPPSSMCCLWYLFEIFCPFLYTIFTKYSYSIQYAYQLPNVPPHLVWPRLMWMLIAYYSFQ